MAKPLIIALAGLALTGCRPMIYDIDRMADPTAKARFSCQYLLERALARDDEKDSDGVLRRRVADFAEPHVNRDGETLMIVWRAGSITLRSDGSRHHGSCTMTPRPQGRFVSAVTLDGQPLAAGFGM